MNQYTKIKKLGHCPDCGSTEFIILARVRGSVPYIESLIGEECDNDSMYDGLDYTYNQWCVCAGCNKRLFKYIDYVNSRELK